MVQDILVILIITATIAKTTYNFRKFWLKRKTSAHTCGGCGHCALKKSIVRHGQR